jgi:TonB family protein
MMTRCTSLLFALLAGAGFLPSAYAVDDYWMADRYAVKLSFDAGEPGDRGKMNEPTVLSVPMPYPGELLASGLEGMVRVSYTVLEDGSVTDVKVLKSWLNDFEKPTLEAIRKWRFHPAVSVATKKPVRATMLCEVEFEPEEDASVLDWKPGPSALAAKDAVRVFFDQEGKVLHCAADSLDGWLTVILSGRITISSWRLKDLVLPVDIDHCANYQIIDT